MSQIHRYLRPGATALVALALAVVALAMRPTSHGYIRPITHDGEALVYYTAQQGGDLDNSLDDLLLSVFLTGTMLIFIGAMVTIWYRSRPAGKHRAPR